MSEVKEKRNLRSPSHQAPDQTAVGSASLPQLQTRLPQGFPGQRQSKVQCRKDSSPPLVATPTAPALSPKGAVAWEEEMKE